MAQIISLPNGHELEFPDSMSENDITSVIRREYPGLHGSQKSNDLMSSIGDILKGAGVGAAQGISNIGANVAQFPGDIYSYLTGNPSYKSPRPDLGQYVPESAGAKTAANLAEFAAPIALPGLGSHALGSKLLSKLLAGSAIGAAESEDRPAGAALGAAGSLIAPVTNLLRQSTSKNIANRLLIDKADIRNKYSELYNSLFKNASEKGIKDINPPKINFKAIEGSGMPKYHKSLKEFMSNPTLENAHRAQSELGGLERNLNKVSEISGLTPTQTKALKEAQKAKLGIQEAMFSKHMLGSQPGLSNQYKDITSGYREQVVPWQSAKGLEDFSRGEIKASDLTKKLLSNKKFMAQLGGNYPTLRVNSILKNPYLKQALLTGLGLEGAHKAYEVLNG